MRHEKSDYERECDDFALFGDPYQEHLDHEFAVRFQRDPRAEEAERDARMDWECERYVAMERAALSGASQHRRYAALVPVPASEPVASDDDLPF